MTKVSSDLAHKSFVVGKVTLGRVILRVLGPFPVRMVASMLSTHFDLKTTVNKKVQLDATVCRHLFTAESL